MKRNIVISPASMAPPVLKEQLSSILSDQEIEAAGHLAFTSTHFDLNDARGTPAHVFTPLDDSVKSIVVVKQYPVIYANHFTASWLALMLHDIGPGGKVYLEIPNERSSIIRGQMTPDYLTKVLPGCKCERQDETWVVLDWDDELAKLGRKLQTLYPFLHRGFDDYLEALRESLRGEDSFETKSRYFVYALFGANQKSFLSERILRHQGIEKTLRGCDLGGGFGFWAADMAMKGHSMHVMDSNPHHVFMVNWIAKRCGLDDRLTSSIGDFHAVVKNKEKECYDVVSFFGSLLYSDRAKTPEILRASMDMVRHQGLLLIHEGPRESANPSTPDYSTRFHTQELLSYIDQASGKSSFYNVFTGVEMKREDLANKVIMAAIRKV